MNLIWRISSLLGRNAVGFLAISLLIVVVAFFPIGFSIKGGAQDTWSFSGDRYQQEMTTYVTGLVKGDLGTAPPNIRWMQGQPNRLMEVTVQLVERSIKTLLPAVFGGILFGALLGALSFFLPEWLRKLFGTSNQIVFSLPDLLIIFVLQYLVVQFDKAMGSPIIQVVEISNRPALLLPVLCVATPISAYIFRYTIQACREAQNQEFVRTARAKGLPNYLVFFKHVMRPATDSLLSVTPRMVAIGASSLLIVERLFNITGITLLFYSGPNIPFVTRMIATVLIVLAAIVFVTNILTSLLRLWVNPALRK